jgi:hypothetical protein
MLFNHPLKFQVTQCTFKEDMMKSADLRDIPPPGMDSPLSATHYACDCVTLRDKRLHLPDFGVGSPAFPPGRLLHIL